MRAPNVLRARAQMAHLLILNTAFFPFFFISVVFQRPPSGRKQVITKHTNNHDNHAPSFKTTHLLFEPTPPPLQQPRKVRSSYSSHNRRIQSAHGRIGSPSQPSKTQNVKNRVIVNKTRPQSAREHRVKQSVPVSTPVPKQFITLNINQAADTVTETKRTSTNGCVACNSERTSLQQSHTCSRDVGDKVKRAAQGRLIPKGIIQLAPWLTENVPHEL